MFLLLSRYQLKKLLEMCIYKEKQKAKKGKIPLIYLCREKRLVSCSDFQGLVCTNGSLDYICWTPKVTETLYRIELFGYFTPGLIKGFRIFSFLVCFSTLIFKKTEKRNLYKNQKYFYIIRVASFLQQY